MRTAVYKKWLHDRKFTLPDEEEKKLMKVIKRSKHNQSVQDIKNKTNQKLTEDEFDLDENYGPAPPVPKENTTTAATIGVKALMANRALYFNPDGSRKKLTFSFLPLGLRERIFTYLPVADKAVLEDLGEIERILSISDCEILRDADLAEEVTETILSEIRGLHSLEYGEYSVVAVSMGLAANTFNPLKKEYGLRLDKACSITLALSERQKKYRQWNEFRQGSMETTCANLRSTFRGDLALWRNLLTEWKTELVSQHIPQDVMSVTAFEELAALEQRAGGVEFLGSDLMELDDVRNMCFELDLPLPQGVTEDYTKSLTLAQTITLGMIDIPWVKGYAWEDRAAVLEKEEEEELERQRLEEKQQGAAGKYGAKRQSVVSTAASSQGGEANENRRRALIAASTVKQRRALERAAAEEEKRRQIAAEEKAEKERLEKIERQKAACVAADSMTQRIWISTQQYQQRWHHRFGGCEYCSCLPIHHVGLKKEGSATTSDIALCRDCYQDLYSDESSVAHRMYIWYWVEDLVGKMEAAPIVPLEKEKELSPLAQELAALKKREEEDEEKEREAQEETNNAEEVARDKRSTEVITSTDEQNSKNLVTVARSGKERTVELD